MELTALLLEVMLVHHFKTKHLMNSQKAYDFQLCVFYSVHKYIEQENINMKEGGNMARIYFTIQELESMKFRELPNIVYEKILQDNDCYHGLQAIDGLVMTGPTGTNVNDFWVALIGQGGTR